MQTKTRNKATNYGSSVTFRINTEVFEKFKKVTEIKGKKYNVVLRELIDYYLRANNQICFFYLIEVY